MKFDSTILPSDNSAGEIKKMGLDLLSKINSIADAVTKIDAIHGSWYSEKTTSFTIGDLDHYAVYGAKTGTNALVATLPAPANNKGRIITFIKTDVDSGTLQITDLLSTWTSLYLINQYDTLTVQSDGAAWSCKSGPVQPVSSEPSLGTPHDHFAELLNTDPADTNWHSIDLSSIAGGAIKAVDIIGTFYGTVANISVHFSNASAGNNYAWQYTQNTAVSSIILHGRVPVDANKYIWWKVDAATIAELHVWMMSYWC
ncbi:MAG: hypothetical protein WC455_16015 [Dehalococcoidia bacterium]|jgi:hypothetical protein